MSNLTLLLIRLAFLAVLWLFVIAAVGVVRTDMFGPSMSGRQQRRQRKAQQPTFNFKNIGLIIASLCFFAMVSQYVNMIAGIVVMVFVAAIAGTSYSVVRNLQISVGLILVALVFQKLLGFNLPLY